MRKKIVAGNWKMNLNYAEAMTLADAIADGLQEGDCEVVLAPAFPYLQDVLRRIGHHERISVAAQNCASIDKGAFTGEVSASMLASIGVEFVIIGHSERRTFFHDSDKALADKVRLALLFDLIPIFCCGESLQQREDGHHLQVIASQLESALFMLDVTEILSTVIAYEPVWAIGTGMTADPIQAQEMHAHIRSLLSVKYGSEVAKKISVIYGGSVTAANAESLFSCSDIDGALVGGASLKADDFLEIVKVCG
ncbi:MAG: triose-phosphate isomerase [Bacteroidota bacterium]